MKKLIALMSALFVLTAALPAFGEKSLPEEAIKAAKTAFAIDEELSEFSYDVERAGDSITYFLTWRDKANEKSVCVCVNNRLVPTSYSCNFREESRGLSSIRKSDGEKTAMEFLKRAVPDVAEKLVPSADSTAGHYIFNRFENGVLVENNRATVNVSKESGKVTFYDLSWDFENDFCGNDKTGKDAAYFALSRDAVLTEYRVLGDKALPVYAHKANTYISADDATAFENVQYTNFKERMAYSTMEAEDSAIAGDSGGSYKLTAEERTAIEKMSSLISEDALKELIASMPELYVPDITELVTSYTTRKHDDKPNSYLVRCTLDTADSYATFTFDAETGELKNFYSYNNLSYISPEKPVPDETLAATADGFLSRLKELEGYRLSEDSYNNDYSFERRYIRYVNDIPYPADHMSVTLSKNTGKIMSYRENKPEAEIITPAALCDRCDAVKNNFNAELVYTYALDTDPNSTLKPVLAYKLSPKGSFYCLSAADGSALDYSGKKYTAPAEKTDETDHWAWELFNILRENNIYIEGSYSFDDCIKGSQLRELIDRLRWIDAVPYRYYRDLNADTDEDAPVDREETARLIAVCFGWEKLIDPDIYSVKFADSGDFDGGIGAAAILNGLKVMTADEGGNFAPKAKLTYGQAYAIVYRLAMLN